PTTCVRPVGLPSAAGPRSEGASMAKATRVSTWWRSLRPARTPLRRTRLALHPSDPLAALRPGSAATVGLAGTPVTAYSGPGGDQVAAAPAFDAATGR